MSGRERVVRHRLADGTIKEYVYAARKAAGPKPRTVGALIAEYRASPDFAQKAANTKQVYLRALDYIGKFENVRVADVKRRTILGHRDAFADKVGLANQILATWSLLMAFAVDREYIEHSPALRIRHLAGGTYRRWPQAALDAALAQLHEPLRRAVILGLYTGQRAGDCVAMLWSDFDGASIHVVQQKTGARLWIPCHETLLAEMASWKTDATTLTILANSEGRPWKSRTFATMISAGLRRIPEARGLVFHGLRKSAAAALAEAGCSVHEIAAITGHSSLAMLELYTREADQRGRASAAIVKWERKRPEKAG